MWNNSTFPDTRALNSERSTLKDSNYFNNNLFINELNRRKSELNKPKAKYSPFWFIVDAVGIIVLVIYLIIQR